MVLELAKRKLHLHNSLNPSNWNDFVRLSACLHNVLLH
jgi:hypothetical protein